MNTAVPPAPTTWAIDPADPTAPIAPPTDSGAATRRANTTVPRALAVWNVRRPWLRGLLVSLGGVVLTAAGSAAGQLAGLGNTAAIGILAAFVAASALVGLLIMRASRRPLAIYGFRAPDHTQAAAWGLPLVALPLLVSTTSGFHLTSQAVLAYAALTIAVAFNEEIWFRGLAQAALRGYGHKQAILIGAALFGLLHLANAAGGASPLYLVLQVGFAGLVGLVLAEIAAITGSLWIGIAWHALYDFISYAGGDALTPATLAALAVECLILAAYAAFLWRRLPDARPLAG